MTTLKSIVERPEGTYSIAYYKSKDRINAWRSNNKEYITKYNREYQRKLRKDPVKYNELKMRIMMRRYLGSELKNSFKTSSAIGMTREQLALSYDMTEKQFVEMLKTHEIDHIVSASWFNDPKNIHLKPFMYRYYNLQFIPEKTNRNKHKFVDMNDLRVQLVIAMLELDYHNSINKYNAESFYIIQKLSKKAKLLQTKIGKIYKQ